MFQPQWCNLDENLEDFAPTIDLADGFLEGFAPTALAYMVVLSQRRASNLCSPTMKLTLNLLGYHGLSFLLFEASLQSFKFQKFVAKFNSYDFSAQNSCSP